MATIPYAILLREEEDSKSGEGGFTVRHIYRHLTEAKRCADAYWCDLGRVAAVVAISPPLAVVRGGDAWAVLDGATLRVYASQSEALEAARGGAGSLVAAPIRQAMPVNHGTPQFSAVARPPTAAGPPA